MIEFRLLGPLEVAVDGEILDIGSSRQRVVLSMLLLQSNRMVPIERLVDAIWDDKPPATARSQVQACVSALRRQLDSVGAGRVIVTRSTGYAISVPDDALDFAAFEHLVSQGRAASADDRAEDAVPDLRAALALWRGLAAANVESRLVQAAATRLNESRLSVLEECIELELGLGRHHDLTGELSELVVQYPLRERLRAQYMLALYRSARQAEALEAFRQVRQIFLDELGIDPGEELCALESAILANDRALELEPGVRNRPGWTRSGGAEIPRQLPAAVADLTGRDDVLDRLSALLSAHQDANYLPVVTLTGKGGVGKTALALHAAHALRQRYCDGQLFAQLREADGQPISSLELLAQFLRALGLAPTAMPSTLAERSAVYRSLLGERRVLIVLDDADNVNQVMPLIPGSPHCAVIITSRNPLLSLPGADRIEIGDIDERSAIELLSRIIGSDRVQAEVSAALALVRLCGCLPLALRIVAAKLTMRAHWRIGQMVRRMTDERQRLDELALSGVGIRATLSLSYNSLSKDARRLFRLLALLGTADFASWVSAPLLDLDADAAADLLDTLVAARLVEVRVREAGSPRFRLHDLIRIYATEQLSTEEPTAQRASALARILGCWLSLATEAHRRWYGGHYAVLHGRAEHWPLPAEIVDELLDKPLSWFRDEHAGLVSAVLQAGQAGLDELCWDLAMTSVTLFESEYQVDDWRRTHEVALEVTRRTGNRRGEAAILYSLGNLAVGERLGDATRYLDPALRIFDSLGDVHGRALTLAILGFVDRLVGSYEQALSRYQEALSCFRDVGDRVGEADALTNIAEIQTDRGQFGAVEDLFDQALAICRALNAPRLTAQTEHRLGDFLLRRGALERAERSFKYVLELVRDESDVVGEAYALLSLGVVYTRQERYARAEADLVTALGLARRLGDHLVHGRALLAAAELYLATDDRKSASAMIEEALVVFSELGPAAIWRARFLELKARLDERSGRAAAAAAGRQAALDLVRDLDPELAGTLAAAIARTLPQIPDATGNTMASIPITGGIEANLHGRAERSRDQGAGRGPG